MDIVPVILCGGNGARLWPLSRGDHPKPLIRAEDGLSLLQHALMRALALPGNGEIMTVTRGELLPAVEVAYRQFGADFSRLRFLLEPEGRDTAAAVAAASLEAEQALEADTLLWVMPADHLITDVPALVAAVERAAALAREDRLVTFGIRPDRPATGYGYIEAAGTEVRRFVEKPDARTAEAFFAVGGFLWNAGMFCFRPRTMIGLMERLCPDVLDGCSESLRAARRGSGAGGRHVALDATFARSPAISLDRAVLEKAPKRALAVVPCDIGWSDVGCWAGLGARFRSDAQGNRAIGAVTAVEAHDNIVYGDGRTIGLLGVEGLVIADTPDALLVADRRRSQDVKLVHERLKGTGGPGRRVERPWGAYTVLDEGEGFKVKRIEVAPGARLSLQAHRHRAEHWVVVAGTAEVVNSSRRMTLGAGQTTYIRRGAVHRLENPGPETLVVMEVQTGEHLAEDDILRLDDAYGRH